MAIEIYHDPDLEWLDHVPPVGLVVAPTLLKELGLCPIRQTPIDTGLVAEIIGSDLSMPALTDPWAFVEKVLGWEVRHVAGAPSGPAIPDELLVALPEHGTTLRPTWAVAGLGESDQPWQLLVRIEAPGIDPDARNALDGWEATPHQRFERLLRDTGVFAGLLISERDERRDGEVRYYPEFRLIYAPRGETSGHQSFPIRPMAMAAGRPMLGGLKLLLDRNRLLLGPDDRRLPALLKRSRDAQALVSTALAEQVLGALHELLRGLDSAEPALVRELAASRPDHLYEGLLTVLMRLVFVLYAEDRDLLPSRSDARAREIYETSYSVRGLYAKLTEDAALNPDTMDERRGGWGGLLALFRLIHKGHQSGFVQARGGKLFDPDEFPFLEGRASKDDPARIMAVSDGCLLRILEGLMTLKLRGAERERLSYRTLDVEQIGSVYETVMGFTVEAAKSRVLAIKAGKNNKTPVFVALDELLTKKAKDRIKELKDNAGRSLTAAQAKPVEDAKSVEDLAAALDGMVDERGSPKKRIAASGTPILQPTGERRRTGSHYTPRSLTAPIVKYALEPAFERLGPDATPEQVLELKVCDPAMGSGAFLVEACRALGERLVAAWARWPETRPAIPADEDEELHARRLVAQRCLYGVDKNPRAVDLARLSLWLATLARDHEFTFLDHALKCGDSLVGLTARQIGRLAWKDGQSDYSPFDGFLQERVAEAMAARREIQDAPDDIQRAIQEARHRHIEARLNDIRTIGDSIITAFFSVDKPKQRETARQQLSLWASLKPEYFWPKLREFAAGLYAEPHSLHPFHWEIEFPEVFAQQNKGFDAIVGNPPFLGGKKISTNLGDSYRDWLTNLHKRSNNNTDIVGHFFLRAFNYIQRFGGIGLVATNKISQGDTRSGALEIIVKGGGTIRRAVKRLRWPGDAEVVVSILHIDRDPREGAWLNNRSVSRISSYLVEGSYDDTPNRLASNDGKSFIGSFVLGMGFTFDDSSKASLASPISVRDEIVANCPTYAQRIFPFIGNEELSNDPEHLPKRFIFNLSDLDEFEARQKWPKLLEIAEARVKPQRSKLKRDVYRLKWWRFAEPQNALYDAIGGMKFVLATGAAAAMHHMIARIPSNVIFSHKLCVFVFDEFSVFAVMQSSVHEIWSRAFGTTFGSIDALTYNPTQVFRTFPFPPDFGHDPGLGLAGLEYHGFRAKMMVESGGGLTATYNRFHDRADNKSVIVRLRVLHHEMDVAVLRSYGWDDLADRAAPEFIEQEADEGKTPKTRLDWPPDFKDEVLARLLALNAERAATERAAGLSVAQDDGGSEFDDEEDSE